MSLNPRTTRAEFPTSKGSTVVLNIFKGRDLICDDKNQFISFFSSSFSGFAETTFTAGGGADSGISRLCGHSGSACLSDPQDVVQRTCSDAACFGAGAPDWG